MDNEGYRLQLASFWISVNLDANSYVLFGSIINLYTSNRELMWTCSAVLLTAIDDRAKAKELANDPKETTMPKPVSCKRLRLPSLPCPRTANLGKCESVKGELEDADLGECESLKRELEKCQTLHDK
jgi:hypothetical protein